MKVAVVHYHLEPGGVTRVIENTLEAFSKLPEQPQIVVLTGRPYLGDRIEKAVLVEGLNYASPNKAPDPTLLRENLETASCQALGSSPDLWHIHNHSLGKNPALPEAVHQLAEQGQALLLHLHDFAEDGRPGNHQALAGIYHHLYPAGSRIRYAALNQRDYSYLKDLTSGHPASHLLPNAIPKPSNITPADENANLPENLYLYPVRAVRRKNLGELALLAASHPEFHFANSLGPTNPAFRPTYQCWKNFATERKLPLTLGIGDDLPLSFQQIVANSHALLTTSVAEGFGLGFLEPWTYGKSLLGRDLPEITADFTAAGLSLPHLYQRLDLPADLLPAEANLDARISSALTKIYNAYSRPFPTNAFERSRSSIVSNDRLDFGRLDESLQEQLISTVASSTNLATSIRAQANLREIPPDTIEANANAVLRNFSPNAYAQRLLSLYAELAATATGPITNLDSSRLLDNFLRPECLNLLRTN